MKKAGFLFYLLTFSILVAQNNDDDHFSFEDNDVLVSDILQYTLRSETYYQANYLRKTWNKLFTDKDSIILDMHMERVSNKHLITGFFEEKEDLDLSTSVANYNVDYLLHGRSINISDIFIIGQIGSNVYEYFNFDGDAESSLSGRLESSYLNLSVGYETKLLTPILYQSSYNIKLNNDDEKTLPEKSKSIFDARYNEIKEKLTTKVNTKNSRFGLALLSDSLGIAVLLSEKYQTIFTDFASLSNSTNDIEPYSDINLNISNTFSRLSTFPRSLKYELLLNFKKNAYKGFENVIHDISYIYENERSIVKLNTKVENFFESIFLYSLSVGHNINLGGIRLYTEISSKYIVNNVFSPSEGYPYKHVFFFRLKYVY